jgi:hypothetical protein
MKDHLRYELLPDVRDEATFMLQVVPSEDPSCPLLVFYDSGCSATVLSDPAHYSLNPFTASKGPTRMDIAGGKTLMVPHGNDRFHLQVEDGVKVKATITGFRLAHVIMPFLLMKLREAWEDARETTRRVQPGLSIPNIDSEVGGQEVDILLGIRYLKIFLSCSSRCPPASKCTGPC